jgi:hypothetical protein
MHAPLVEPEEPFCFDWKTLESASLWPGWSGIPTDLFGKHDEITVSEITAENKKCVV